MTPSDDDKGGQEKKEKSKRIVKERKIKRGSLDRSYYLCREEWLFTNIKQNGECPSS